MDHRVKPGGDEIMEVPRYRGAGGSAALFDIVNRINRSGGLFRLDGCYASCSGTNFANEPVAALADVAGAAASYAGFFHDHRRAVVMHRKPLSKSHSEILEWTVTVKTSVTLSTAD